MSATTRRGGAAAVLSVSIALSLAACSSAGVEAGNHAPRDRGTVNVLYAGSLVRLMEQDLGPRFTAATGYRFSGFAGGSVELAHEIESGVREGDVFVSASPGADAGLEGSAGGHWVSWFITFARAPLVLGYNPHSRFATALRTRPWYEVVTSPGFLLGRTDPVLDPKGQLTVQALRETARRTGDRTLLRTAEGSSGVFPEETLLGRLEAGQLDAAFLYKDEARAAAIPTVSLAPVSLAGTFTVTALTRGADAPGARAFVRFLLGRSGRRAFASAGFEVLDPPTLHGTGAPRSLSTLTSRR